MMLNKDFKEKEVFMRSVQKSLRLPSETMKEIEQMAKETGQDFSNITKDLLQEAIKMRRCPGILFAQGTRGRECGGGNRN